jgi:hypothetical protein
LRKVDYTVIGLGIALAIMCALMFVSASQKTDLQRQLKASTVQNVQLTKAVHTAKVESFKDGVIVCQNEDIDYLNSLAAEYQGTALFKLFNQMAMGWAYDDDSMQRLIEAYMNEGTN